MSSKWAKFEVPRAAVKSLPALSDSFKREGAWRACLLSRAEGAVQPGEGYSVIKVPALEGTELWLVPSAEKAAVDAAAGFSKASVPLMTIPGEELLGALDGESPEATDETVGNSE